MNSMQFIVADWVVWSSETAAPAWRRAGADGPLAVADLPAGVPANARRRATAIGRRALAAAAAVMPVAEPCLVFASRHGEYTRTDTMLRMLAETGAVAPADFSMAVHHALAGLLSIATGNRQSHTAIAAGEDTFGFALMEAAGCLAERPERPVLVVYYDEPLPAIYPSAAAAAAPPLAAALALSAAGPGARVAVAMTPVSAAGTAGNLAGGFLDFLLSGSEGGVMRGDRMDWRWHRDC